MRKFAARYVREGEIVNDISLIYETTYKPEKNFNIDTIVNTLVEGAKKYYLNKDFQEDELIISLKSLNQKPLCKRAVFSCKKPPFLVRTAVILMSSSRIFLCTWGR